MARATVRNAAGNSTGNYQAWSLNPYIAGPTPRGALPFANLKRIGSVEAMHQSGALNIVYNPQLEGGNQIITVHSLVRWWPQPVRTITGARADAEGVLGGLERFSEARAGVGQA
jgi:hypothetical protein